MIDKSKIENLVNAHIAGTDMFLVEVSVTPQNAITVFLDSDTSLGLDACIATSKFIESNLDREAEDFELCVSSAGLTEPLKVTRQYVKNIGRDLWVTTTDGMKVTGKLVAFNGTSIDLEVEKKVKLEASNKKQLVAQTNTIDLAAIKQATLNLKF